MTAGTRLGPYEIQGALGAGGMGEVHRARDTKLNRDVAIKVLPEALALDADPLARFTREAQTLASLNHPNIATIFGIEESKGVRALVMELVEGEDLSTRLARGALPLDEALPIARQIADALEAAHDQGIVHRDLKPANVKVRRDGTVKVLDFGLAKAFDPAAAGSRGSGALASSPTFTSPAMTAMGVILGTAAYMAPEQAKGQPVDKRADIWAFGVVLYEMLSGKHAFGRPSVTETLSAVLRDELDLDALGPGVPPRVRRLLERCLRKDPRARLRDIGDARLELDELGTSEGVGALPSPGPRSRAMALLPWLLAAALAIALFAWPRAAQRAAAPVPVRRFAIDLPWRSAPNWTDFDVALSPDGAHVAYFGRHSNDNDVEVYVRALDSLAAVALGDARETGGMAFSPDGEWLALADPPGLRKVSIRGGKAQPLARVEHADGLGLSWGRDGAILVGHASGLLRVPSAGGPAESVTRVNSAAGETAHVDPFHLPDGTHALMTIERGEQSQLALLDLLNRTYRPLGLSGSNAVYSSGYVAFRQGTSVLAVRFDPKANDVVGEPVPVLEHVHRGPYVAVDSTMLYVPERGDSSARLVSVDRGGHPSPVPGERLDYSHLALGAAGRQALLNISSEVYVRDIERGTRRLLASGDAWFPIWSPDGRWATYRSRVGEKRIIARQLADGSASPETLVESGESLVPTSWNSRTGELAFFDEASDIWILPPGGTARRFLATSYNERSGRFSPDGRWLAFVSDETGTFQVYVVPYPGPGPKVAVSAEGGLEPIWSADGRELFFRRGGRVLAARMTFAPTLAAGHPVELFDGPYTLDLLGHQRWDIGPDGRFLMVENSDDFRSVLVQNWTVELNRVLQGPPTR